ncbi:hypothetical protein [uncultured Photobacterium sp.]|uniref:hypothetical protein n=1 Tax=uncultured Photobacterium sp. TaxID=173973 RepID=UPI002636D79C|nr:hypothetical protein [uncultured Photobacterium sp.]
MEISQAALKAFIEELKEEERYSNREGDKSIGSGITFARVRLEVFLESHGFQRSCTIDVDAY